MQKKRTRWTEALLVSRINAVVGDSKRFPTNSHLVEIGQGDLSNQITKRGGFIYWANRLGIERDISDSDIGWEGEKRAHTLLEARGFSVIRSERVRWPFDLLVNNSLRVDVKTASYAAYGASTGWFFRIGKSPQADLIALYRSDKDDMYLIPWYHVPKTNITISPTGMKYSRFLNAYEIVERMVRVRSEERDAHADLAIP
jgi:hypothetical protein